MTIESVGILSPGDMGHTVGQVLRCHGLRVITCLAGRSDLTRRLAEAAGIEDVPTYRDLVRDADLILSILVPAQARQAGELVAQTIEETKSQVLFVDCNAIAPHTVSEIGTVIESAGGRFVDASIIGPPPRQQGTTRFYASGPAVSDFEGLRSFGLDIVSLGDAVGQASAIKMCYASLTKGLAALSLELLTAAHKLGVYESLINEFKISQKSMLERMERQLPGIPSKAHRWVGEMEEIAATFSECCGLTPFMLRGAADMYRLVSQPSSGKPDPSFDSQPAELRDMIADLARRTEAVTRAIL